VITLEDAYNSIAGVHLTYEDASFSDAGSTGFEVTTETVGTTKLITLKHFAADEGNGQTRALLGGKTIHCMIWLKNSSV
jgi:hypothetical protein